MASQTYKVYDDSTNKSGFVVFDNKIGLMPDPMDIYQKDLSKRRIVCREYTYKEALHVVDSINEKMGGGWHLPTAKQVSALCIQMFGTYNDKPEMFSFQIKDIDKKISFNKDGCKDCANIEPLEYWTSTFSYVQREADYFKWMHDSIPCNANYKSNSFFYVKEPKTGNKRENILNLNEVHALFLVKDF